MLRGYCHTLTKGAVGINIENRLRNQKHFNPMTQRRIDPVDLSLQARCCVKFATWWFVCNIFLYNQVKKKNEMVNKRNTILAVAEIDRLQRDREREYWRQACVSAKLAIYSVSRVRTHRLESLCRRIVAIIIWRSKYFPKLKSCILQNCSQIFLFIFFFPFFYH